MKKIVWITFLCSLAFISCQQDEWADSLQTEAATPTVRLRSDRYENDGAHTRQTTETDAPYDRVEFYVVDEDGAIASGLKGIYNHQNQEIKIEGLKEGEYELLILAIKGNLLDDGATIHPLKQKTDQWISFPSDLQKPLEAEYFYSKTPFSVSREAVAGGHEYIVHLPAEIVQKRIMGRLDLALLYNNDDVRTAATQKTLSFHTGTFYTAFTGDGGYAGQSNGQTDPIELNDQNTYWFMPTTADAQINAEIGLTTTHYRGGERQCSYLFGVDAISPNRIEQVYARMEHPDDYQGTMYITRQAYNEGNHAKILQDGESKTIYADPAQRRFNTAHPLQIKVNDAGQLHARFYSPRDLKRVLIKVQVPSVSNEYFDLAYFDSIPAFADFFHEVAISSRNGMYRTESGKLIEIGNLTPAQLAEAQYKIESDDPYWAKIKSIVHGWDIYFSLYGGDPDLPNGGPVGNWMGIRPVHCREVVAMFINFTYMIDMDEHEEILRANEDILYGNGGVDDKVTADQVLSQMRRERTLQVGLVYSGNGVIGLGGGIIFGAYQNAWLTHYNNTYACEIMFHELGHVMGYNHSSAFTYGPWAQQLMNNFYVNNLHKFPIDSPSYLNSRNNPTLYP